MPQTNLDKGSGLDYVCGNSTPTMSDIDELKREIAAAQASATTALSQLSVLEERLNIWRADVIILSRLADKIDNRLTDLELTVAIIWGALIACLWADARTVIGYATIIWIFVVLIPWSFYGRAWAWLRAWTLVWVLDPVREAIELYRPAPPWRGER